MKLESRKANMVVGDDTHAKIVLNQVFEYTKSSWLKSNADIVQMVMELPRDFKNKNIKFGWKHVDDIFLRDEKRIKLNKGRRTDIVRHEI